MLYQFNSATCRDTYGLPDFQSVKKGEDESRALCTSEYSDISPLRDGNIAFSSLEGRPSAINFEHSGELQVINAVSIRKRPSKRHLIVCADLITELGNGN